ncbi:uncharacterized protein LOC126667473 [Mercurialis annua]|uniref:uncharacterized protein LOC126667473 n=1 Tax=Mercurialis annua TaxID=3986 RepID=UPI00215FD3DB|nr:uncharacterized protein LOC126667473 [Mercurialis annua]
MTTLEKLFVQILESNKRTIEQVKNHTQLFDQHLASLCLLQDLNPPSWLLPSHPNQLNKEELISELLLPRPRPANPFSSSYHSQCRNHVVTNDSTREFPTASCTEVGASHNGTNPGDRLFSLPTLPDDDDTRCTTNGVAELDPSVTSPVECADARMIDNTYDGVSALDSGLPSPPDCGDARKLDNTCNGVAASDPTVTSPPDRGDARVFDSSADHNRSLVKIQRSKSRQRDLQLRNSSKVRKTKLSDEDNDGHGRYNNQRIGSGINSLQYDHVDDLVLDKPVDVDNGGCAEEEHAKVAKGGGKEDIHIFHGEALGSGNSTQQASSIKVDCIKYTEVLIEQPNNCNEIPEMVDHSVPATESFKAEEANMAECRNTETNGIVCSDKITRGRSSSQPSTLKKTLGAGNSSCIAEKPEKSLDKLSSKQPSSRSELLKLMDSPSAVSYERHRFEAKTSNKHVNDKGSDSYDGRITRSKSSSQQSNCVNKHLDIDCFVRDSTGVKDNTRECLNDGAASNAYCDRIRSSSSIQKLNNVKEFSEVDNSSDMMRDDNNTIVESLGKSSQPPQVSSVGHKFNFQAPSRTQPNVLPCTETVTCVTDKDCHGPAQVHSVTSKCNSENARCGMQVLDLRSLSEYAELVNPKQLNFDDLEDNSLLKTCDPASEYIQEDIEKRVSPLQSTDVMNKLTSVGYQEMHNLSTEKQLLEEHELSRKSCKESSEFPMMSDAVLVKESTMYYMHQQTDPCIYQNHEADSGSWPQHKRIKIGGQHTKAVSSFPNLKRKPYQPTDTYGKGNSAPLDVKCPVEDMHCSVENKKIEESEVSLSKLHVDEVQISLEGINRSACNPSPLMPEQQGTSSISNLKRLAVGVSQSCLSEKGEVTDSVSTVFGEIEKDSADENRVTWEYTSEENQVTGEYTAEENQVTGEYTAVENLVTNECTAEKNRYRVAGKYTAAENQIAGENPAEEILVTKDYTAEKKEDRVAGEYTAAENRVAAETTAEEILVTKECTAEKNQNRVAGENTAEEILVTEEYKAEKNQVAEEYIAEENLVSGECNEEENRVLSQLEGELEFDDAEILNYTEHAMQEIKYHFEGNDNLPYSSSGSPMCQPVIGNDQNMPEFEGFFMGTDEDQPCTSKGVNFDNWDLESLFKSTCLHTPLSHFSATYRLNEALILNQSIPKGLLEEIEMRNTLNMHGDGSEQLGGSYSFLDEEIDTDRHAISLPLSSNQSACDITKPYMSPVAKFWDGIPLKSGSSGKRVSSVSELPCINEENETADDVPDILLEGTGAELVVDSVKREPLADISKNLTHLLSVYETEMCDDRGSLASMKTQVSFSGTCDRAKTKLGNKSCKKRRITRKDNENNKLSLGRDDIKGGKGSLQNTFSRPKLSGKASFRNGPSVSEKETRANNIVSNITSFIPFVQQKQAAAAAVITGKRDIKVKALEAAETAKRNAEKKENERMLRKEAMKAGRAKAEENLRQLELEKKKKEEERKKKEADMAAKKRQRGEDEKERKIKRMRVEEAKRLQLAHDKKSHVEKEDEKAHKRKESKARLGKLEKIQRPKEDKNLQMVPQTEPKTSKAPMTDMINTSVIPEGHKALNDFGENLKIMESIRKTNESTSPMSCITREQSYEISPYKGSDDEDEYEEDDIRKNKFIPSWASKRRGTTVDLSQQRIDPKSIFPPESFGRLAEVLLPRRLQRK